MNIKKTTTTVTERLISQKEIDEISKVLKIIPGTPFTIRVSNSISMYQVELNSYTMASPTLTMLITKSVKEEDG